MTVSIGVGLLIGIATIVLVVLGSGLDLWSERIRRQTQRERWRKPDDPSQGR